MAPGSKLARFALKLLMEKQILECASEVEQTDQRGRMDGAEVPPWIAR
jgi:hypothetical protein